MKGQLYKTSAGWVVKWSVPQEYKIPAHEVELHPDEVKAREPSVLGFHGEVEFEITSVDYGSGISKGYARILSSPPAVEILSPEERVSVLEDLADKLSQAWYYGNWKAETANEREMESIMRRLGHWPRPNRLKQ